MARYAVLWSKTAQVNMGDVFQVQDDLARQVVDSLALPLTGRERGLLERDVPASGHVYELYLRANHLARGTAEPARLMAARELYGACLEEDPQYAPAWAQIGRVYRVLAKGAERRDEASVQRAREAFERAFALNPQLPLAHHLYTYFEIEELGRADTAMIRLLSQVRDTPTDADLYAGLVVACRYCGLLKASLTADARAQQLDPNLRTSVDSTWFLLSDKDHLRRFADRWEDQGIMLMTLLQENDTSEGRRILADMLPSAAQMGSVGHSFVRAVVAVLDGRVSDMKTEFDRIRQSGMRDPEGLLYGTLLLAQAGEHEDALSLLDEAVDGGFVCTEMQAMPWMAPLRGLERFDEIMRRAAAARDRAAEAFRAADGHRLLGMTES